MATPDAPVADTASANVPLAMAIMTRSDVRAARERDCAIAVFSSDLSRILWASHGAARVLKLAASGPQPEDAAENSAPVRQIRASRRMLTAGGSAKALVAGTDRGLSAPLIARLEFIEIEGFGRAVLVTIDGVKPIEGVSRGDTLLSEAGKGAVLYGADGHRSAESTASADPGGASAEDAPDIMQITAFADAGQALGTIATARSAFAVGRVSDDHMVMFRQSASMPAASMPAASMPAASMPAASMPAASMPAASMPAVDKRPDDTHGHEASEHEAGEHGANEHGASEDGAGEDGAGEDGAGEDGAGEDGAGEDGAGEDGAGEDGAGEDGAGRNRGLGALVERWYFRHQGIIAAPSGADYLSHRDQSEDAQMRGEGSIAAEPHRQIDETGSESALPVDRAGGAAADGTPSDPKPATAEAGKPGPHSDDLLMMPGPPQVYGAKTLSTRTHDDPGEDAPAETSDRAAAEALADLQTDERKVGANTDGPAAIESGTQGPQIDAASGRDDVPATASPLTQASGSRPSGEGASHPNVLRSNWGTAPGGSKEEKLSEASDAGSHRPEPSFDANDRLDARHPAMGAERAAALSDRLAEAVFGSEQVNDAPDRDDSDASRRQGSASAFTADLAGAAPPVDLATDRAKNASDAAADADAHEHHRSDSGLAQNPAAPALQPNAAHGAGDESVTAMKFDEATTMRDDDGAVASSEMSVDPHGAGAALTDTMASDVQGSETATDHAAEIQAEPVEAPFHPDFGRTAARFVWRIDADGRFRSVSPELAAAVGPKPADIVDRPFAEVARSFGIDTDGEVAGLLARRDTWSGRTVLWPVENAAKRVPVDLAALPVYSRDRAFDGFRGFGVVRLADAVDAPVAFDAAASVPHGRDDVSGAPENDESAASANAPQSVSFAAMPEAANTDGLGAENRSTALSESEAIDILAMVSESAEPRFGRRDPADRPSVPEDISSAALDGEKPAASDAPPAAKVIRLEERRGRRDPFLSRDEQAAFRAIGETLGDEERQDTRDDAANIRGDEERRLDAEGPAERSTAPLEQAIRAAGLRVETFERREAAEGGSEESGETRGIAAVEQPPAPHVGRSDRDDDADPAGSNADERPADADGVTGVVLAAEDDCDAGLRPIDEAGVADHHDHDIAEGIDEERVNKGDGGGGIASSADDMPAPPASTRRWNPIEELAISEYDASSVSLHNAAADPKPDPAADKELLEELATVYGSLPLPVLVQLRETLVYGNRKFFDLTGYQDIAALNDAGGLAHLYAEEKAGDGLSDDGGMAVSRADGETVGVRTHMQRSTINGRSCLVMSFFATPWAGAADIPQAAATPDDPMPSRAIGPVTLRDPAAPAGSNTALEGDDAEALRQTVEELYAVLAAATDGVVLLSPDGMIRSMNQPAHALFGIARDDAGGRPFVTLFAHESQKAAADYLDMLRSGQGHVPAGEGREVIGRVAEGGFVPLQVNLGRLPGTSGWCAVIRDISRRKRVEEELNSARQAAEAASLHKSQFLANVSHELRTPLNAIIGFADVIATECFGPIGNERYLEYLDDIKRSGHHVLDLVNDLLDISKIEAGKLDLDFEAVPLNEVLSEIVALMQPQANRERVLVRSNLPTSVPPVVADRRSIRQIALNLVANAIRFTPAGGQIIVSTSCAADGAVYLRFRDSGIGMSEDEIAIAMKPFEQVGPSQRTRGEGTGLGLPLTKALVEANRAQFSLSSTPGEGTLVEILFPPQRVLAD